MGGSGMVDPALFEFVGLRPRGVARASRSGSASSGSPSCATASRDIRLALGQRPPLPEAVLMKVPVSWLRDYVDFDVPLAELADRLAVSTLRGRAHRAPRRRGRGRQPRPLPRRARARGGQASERRPAPALPRRRGGGRAAPDRLRRLELRRRRDGRGRAARRGAPGRDEARAGQAPRHRLRRDDPLRARARARPRPRPGSSCSSDGPEPGTPLADVAAARRGRARGRGDRQPARPARRLRDRARGRARSSPAAPSSSRSPRRATRSAPATSRST